MLRNSAILLVLGISVCYINDACGERTDIEGCIEKDLRKDSECRDNGCHDFFGGKCGNWTVNDSCKFIIGKSDLCTSLSPHGCGCCIPCRGKCKYGGKCRDKCNPNESEDPEHKCGKSCKCCLDKEPCRGKCEHGGKCRDECNPNEFEDLNHKCGEDCKCCHKRKGCKGKCGDGGKCRHECRPHEFGEPNAQCGENCKCCYKYKSCEGSCGEDGTCRSKECLSNEKEIPGKCSFKECVCCRKEQTETTTLRYGNSTTTANSNSTAKI